MGILKGLLTLDIEEVVGSYIDLIEDVVVTPIAVVKDTVGVPEGEGLYPKNTTNQVKNIVEDIL